MTIYNETVEHELSITMDSQQEGDYNPTLESTLYLLQEVFEILESQTDIHKVISILAIEQEISLAGSEYQRTVEDTIEFVEEIFNNGTLPITVEDILDVTQTISEEYVESNYNETDHTVDITQDVLSSSIFNRTVEHTLTITSNHASWKVDTDGAV